MVARRGWFAPDTFPDNNTCIIYFHVVVVHCHFIKSLCVVASHITLVLLEEDLYFFVFYVKVEFQFHNFMR
jgi:hypothetical protein